MKFFLSAIACIAISFLHAQDTTQHIIQERTNSKKQQRKPYIILISADGFRYDLADKYHAINLIALREKGVQAVSMKPSYPSLTFPNHYSIATGLFPAHHGLVDNSFYDSAKQVVYGISNRKVVNDSSFYGGTPLWVLAEQHKMLSASFYWVGSEAAVKGVRPTYYYNYNETILPDARLNDLKNWLLLPDAKRPHLITFYYPEVDDQEHKYGTGSKQTEAAVKFIDANISKMVHMVDSLHLTVNFIFVSDHGMANVDTLHFIQELPVDTSKFIIPRGDALVHIYAKNKADVMPAYVQLKTNAKDYDVYLTDSMPAKWHYSKKDDRYNRLGDIILTAHFPKVFNLEKRKVLPGKHGFDNDMAEMQATFYAWGPAFKKGKQIGSFENVNIYPMIAKVLKLKYKKRSIDGRFKVLGKILK